MMTQDRGPQSLEAQDTLKVGRLHLARCSEGTFLYFPNDLIGRFLDHYGEWSHSETDMLRSLMPKGGVALDVGGNIGWMAVMLAKATGPEGRVYTLEPLEEVYHVLCSNLALNGLRNVVPLRCAAGSESARLPSPKMEAADQQFLSATELGNMERFAKQDTLPDPDWIDVKPLDELFASLDRVDLIKIDIEGMEPEALEGARELIRRCQPKLWIEVNKPEVANRVLPYLAEMGYAGFWHVSPGHNEANYRGSAVNIAGTLGDVNVVAVPKSDAKAFEGFHRATDFSEIARYFPGTLDTPPPRWRKALGRLKSLTSSN